MSRKCRSGLVSCVVAFFALGALPSDAVVADLMSLWVAEDEGVLRIGSVDGELLAEIVGVGPVRALALDLRHGRLWFLAEGILHAYDLAGEPLLAVDLELPSSVRSQLAVHPRDGSVWVAVNRALLSLDAAGHLFATFSLDAPIEALAVDGEHGLVWAATQRGIEARDPVTGEVLLTLDLPRNAAVQDIGLVPGSGELWAAMRDELRRFAPDGTEIARIPLDKIELVAAAPESTAWAATAKQAIRLGELGDPLAVVEPFSGRGTIENLVVAGDGTLWLANQTQIAHLSHDGSLLHLLGFQPPVRIRALAVNWDWIPPEAAILSPFASSCLATTTPALELEYRDVGWGVDPTSVEVLVGGEAVEASCATSDAAASCLVLDPLLEGEVLLGVRVADFGGNLSEPHEVPVILDVTPPGIDLAAPVDGSLTDQLEVTFEGTLSEPAVLTLDGQVIVLGPDLGFTFGPVALEAGENSFELQATDCAGNVGLLAVTVTFAPGADDSEIPPDPSEVAPPIDPTVVTDIHEANRFLWEGAPPIQRGVEPGTIEPRRVAILRGRVLDAEGQPLPGVRVEAHRRPAYGFTSTREDGMFDLAVNGGGRVTLSYSKAGYLTAQRSVDAPWRDFAWAEDVVLVPYDPNVTTIATGSAETQVAEGSEITDEDGTRQARVVFPAETAARIVLPDGTSQPLGQLSIRATEYTVGPSGPQRMPAPLPPSSGYTYAVELSADEAIAAGATRVDFEAPVYLYVENFLDFPVGGIVPVGYYDRELAAWIPSDNGVVIEILDVAGGLAAVDVDGSGEAATPFLLAEHGFSDGELARLAELYQPGQSLWRSPIPHFTPWDCNWPYGPPEDAEPPPDPDGEAEPDDSSDDPNDEPGHEEEDPCEVGGFSVIECENQVLRESVPLPGTGVSLTYSSGRNGMPSARSWRINVSGPSVPPSLKRIELTIRVTGQEIRRTFPPSPNLSYLFNWDGRDAFGRSVQGTAMATATVGFVYPAVYYRANSDLDQAFGFWSPDLGVLRDTRRFEVTVTSRALRKLASNIGIGVGSWSPQMVHQFDTIGGVLYLGDGRQRIATPQDNLVAPIATVVDPRSIAVASDGRIFVASALENRVLRVDPDTGAIDTVAGTGKRGAWPDDGDGGPATEAAVTSPSRVGLSAGGDLYIGSQGCIRRVDPQGIISTLVCGVDGTFFVEPTGELYFTTLAHFLGYQRLWQMSPDGRIVHIAGDPDSTQTRNGMPALEVRLAHIRSITVAADGTMYLAHSLSGFISATGGIMKITPDGRFFHVRTLLGPSTNLGGITAIALAENGHLLFTRVDNGAVYRVNPEEGVARLYAGGGISMAGDMVFPATAGRFSLPLDLAIDHRGRVLVAEAVSQGRIRAVVPSLPGYEVGVQSIASTDGLEMYVFVGGRHVETRDTNTGAVIWRMEYGESGLRAVRNRFGDVTSFSRPSEDLVVITGPFGATYSLTLHSMGEVVRIDGLRGVWEFGYAPGGRLLTSKRNPRGEQFEYRYSSGGRLVRAEDPAGGSLEMSRTPIAGGRRVEAVSAEGVVVGYELHESAEGKKIRKVATQGGQIITTVTGSDGVTQANGPSGAVLRSRATPDPRFPSSWFTQAIEVRSPGGLRLQGAFSRSAELGDPHDPLSLQRMVEEWTINGRRYSKVFDSPKLETTISAPSGRTSRWIANSQGAPVRAEVPGVLAVEFSYDAHGRLIELSQGEGDDHRSMLFTYSADDGRLSSILDPLARTVSFDYDAAGRVIEQRMPDGRTVGFEYDANGNLTAVVPPGRPPHLFRYSAVDRLQAYEPPELGFGPAATLYSYDRDRRLVEVSRPDGRSVHFGYDTAGRRSTITHPRGQLSFGYHTDTGQLTSITGADAGIAYTYDGSLLTSTSWSGPVQGAVSRTFDNNFWLRSRTVAGVPVTFDYDLDGLLTRAGDLTVARDPASGRITGATLGSVQSTLSYDAFGALESLDTGMGGNSLYAATFQRDRLGRIEVKTETVGGLTNVYEYFYDPSGRLERVLRDGTPVEEYSYDENGNRLSAVYPWGAREGTYDAQDRLLTYGDATFTYTEAGELLTRSDATGTSHFEYDVFGNLLLVELPTGDVIEYLVDGQNRRIGRKVNGTLAPGFLYKDTLNPIAELDGSGAVVSRFVYGTRAHVPDYMIRGGVTYRIISDHLGSVRLVVDAATGAIAQRLDYDSFGRVTLDTNPGFQPFGFAGGTYDPFTRLVRFGGRDYAPKDGRWSSVDPLLFAGGLNLYQYANGDPVNFIDRDGQIAIPIAVGVIGAATLVVITAAVLSTPEGQQAAREFPDTLEDLLTIDPLVEWFRDPTFGPAEYRRPWHPPQACPKPGQRPKESPPPPYKLEPADPKDQPTLDPEGGPPRRPYAAFLMKLAAQALRVVTGQ